MLTYKYLAFTEKHPKAGATCASVYLMDVPDDDDPSPRSLDGVVASVCQYQLK